MDKSQALKLPLRRLNSNGMKEINNIYDKKLSKNTKFKVHESKKKEIIEEIDQIIFSNKYTEIVKPYKNEIFLDRENKNLIFLDDFISYLYKKLECDKAENIPVIEPNGLYTWISWFYMNRFLLTNSKTRNLELNEKLQYIYGPEAKSKNSNSYRHIIFSLLNFKKKYPNIKIIFCETYGSYNRAKNNKSLQTFNWGEVRESIFGRTEVLNNRALLSVLDKKYLDEKDGVSIIKRNATSTNKTMLGSLRRLVTMSRGFSVYNQINQIYDIQSMDESEILNQLPARDFGEHFLKEYKEDLFNKKKKNIFGFRKNK